MAKRLFIVCSTLALVASCAQKPENIAPAYVSPTSYQALSCSQLRNEAVRVDAALTQKSEAQRQARANDTMGVILIGLPTSSLSGGNVADQIASLKGQKETIEKTQNLKNCI